MIRRKSACSPLQATPYKLQGGRRQDKLELVTALSLPLLVVPCVMRQCSSNSNHSICRSDLIVLLELC